MNMDLDRYFEPLASARLNNSDTTWATYAGESVIRVLEALNAPGPLDSIKDILVHVAVHQWCNVT
jgi:hypothetical protein